MLQSDNIALSIGANLGEPKDTFKIAYQKLGNKGLSNMIMSSCYETKPVECPLDTPNFTNAIIIGKWNKSPFELLKLCKKIEYEMGRPKIYIKNSPRILDLDIILFKDQVIETELLTIPHKEAHKRFFVLKPLNELVPNWIFPNIKKSVNNLFNSI